MIFEGGVNLIHGYARREIPEHPVIENMERYGEYPHRRRGSGSFDALRLLRMTEGSGLEEVQGKE